ncbi:MAG TPA: TetR/AcrR family transcriptional regulator [Solirubrobacteraceae bacterium]|nr:TetR/AcrR family transcriptional regulator [Solirubrobacteraceae bacterium]
MLDAMLDCIGEQGYAPTVVADVIGRATASRKTFYEQFEDRDACFMALSEQIGADWSRRVNAACAAAKDGDGDVISALVAELLALGCESPAALRLVTVELAAAGAAGVARRKQLLDRLAEPLVEELDDRPSSLLLTQAVIGAILRVLYARARRGAGVRRPRRPVVAELSAALSGWASCYAQWQELPDTDMEENAEPREPPIGGRAPGTLSLSAGTVERRGLPRGEGNVSRSFVVHSQRERILDALANLGAAQSYAATTIPDIVREAAVSVQAFYEHFSGKEDALLVAYEIGHRKALAIVERAYQAHEPWQAAVQAAVTTLLEFLASEPAYAHLALIDAPATGAKAAAIAHDGLIAYSAMLEPGIGPDADSAPWRTVAAEATASAVLELCFVYVSSERARELVGVRDLACEVALRPFASLSVG